MEETDQYESVCESSPFCSVAGASSVSANVSQMCGPCARYEVDEEHEGVGFCVNCKEFLCDPCLTAHRKNKCSAHHIMKDIRELLTDNSEYLNNTEALDKCLEHGLVITDFCRKHNKVCCKKCKKLFHYKCKTTDIKKAAAEPHGHNKTDGAKENIRRLEQSFKQLKFNAAKTKSTVENTHRKALDDFRNVIDKLKEGDLSKLRDMESTCDETLQELNDWKTKLEYLCSSANSERLFVFLHSIEHKMELLWQNSQRLEHEPTQACSRYKFVRTDRRASGRTIGTLYEESRDKQ